MCVFVNLGSVPWCENVSCETFMNTLECIFARVYYASTCCMQRSIQKASHEQGKSITSTTCIGPCGNIFLLYCILGISQMVVSVLGLSAMF